VTIRNGDPGDATPIRSGDPGDVTPIRNGDPGDVTPIRNGDPGDEITIRKGDPRDEIAIRKGDPGDEATLLGLFDEAVAWMVARGQTGQWGDRPFSARPEPRRRVHAMAVHDGLWIAERDGVPVGALIVGSRPRTSTRSARASCTSSC
jgi:hypothetical protein